MRRSFIALTLGLIAIGCAAPETTFNISLHNASTQPVTAWLTKTGGPAEADWLAPEDLSMSRAAAVGKLNGIVIPPGRTGEVGPITGRFDNDSLAVLRVYAGSVSLDTMLATGPDSRLRVDIPLRAGINRLEVKPTLPLKVGRVGEADE